MVFRRDLSWGSSRYKARIMERTTRYVVNRGPRKALEQDRWHDTMDGLYSLCWGAQERWIGNHTSNYCMVA